MKRFAALAALSAILAAGCSREEPVVTEPEIPEPAAQPEDTALESTPEEPAEPAAQTAEPEALEAGELMEGPEEEAESEPVVLAQSKIEPPRPPSNFKEGEHYFRLTPTQPTSSSPDRVEVAEVFWYGCIHCFNLDPFLNDWVERSKESNVQFVRIHAMWNDALQMHARAFYTAKVLGKQEEIHGPLFNEIHVVRNPLNSPALLADFFSRFGIAREEFDKTFGSFAVETELQRADQLNRRYRVSSVPVIVINGKYTTDVSKAGGPEQLLELIDELVAREAERG